MIPERLEAGHTEVVARGSGDWDVELLQASGTDHLVLQRAEIAAGSGAGLQEGLRAGQGPAGLGRGPGLALGRQSKAMQKPRQEMRGLAGVHQSFS